MAVVPNHGDYAKKLTRAVHTSYEKLLHFRRARLKMMNQYVGRFYSPGAMDALAIEEKRAYPMNMMHAAVTTLVPNLVYNDPKAKIRTERLAYRNYASILELAVNHLVREVNFKMTLRKAITDAIFFAGIIKTGIGVSGQTIDLDGIEHDLGQPYADRVDPDDYFVDAEARDREEAYFEGNRFRVNRDFLVESGLYKRELAERLHSRSKWIVKGEASFLSAGRNSAYGDREDVTNYVDLMEVWLPKENIVITTPWDPGYQGNGEIIREVEYEGPERGPYHMLGFAYVPDNIMPVPPAAIWYDLHILGNRIARKLARQADRQKSVLAFESSAWEDAQEIVDADDGESVRVDNIDKIKEIAFGGANDDSFKFMDWTKQQFSDMSMNISLLSGMATGEPTATQAEMVQANVSVRLADMQNMVYQFAAESMGDLVFFLHTDPLIELPLVKRTRGLDEQVFYTPEMREGDWADYNLKVQPFSMARQDPNMKVRRIMEFASNVIPALTSAQQMLGPAFNLEAALNMLGREMGIEDLEEIINSDVLSQQEEMMRRLLESGIPMDPKVIRTLMNPLTRATQSVAPGAGTDMLGDVANMGAPLPGGVRPGQPNPSAGLKAGITPAVERNRRQQETAGELQATYPSVHSIATGRP